jgi:hypothetical protein
MCLLQLLGTEILKTFFIPLDIFKIYPELLTTLETCNGEKIPFQFLRPLLELLEDLSSEEKQYIKCNFFIAGMMPIKSVVTKIINICIIDDIYDDDFYPERIVNICKELCEQ